MSKIRHEIFTIFFSNKNVLILQNNTNHIRIVIFVKDILP